MGRFSFVYEYTWPLWVAVVREGEACIPLLARYETGELGVMLWSDRAAVDEYLEFNEQIGTPAPIVDHDQLVAFCRLLAAVGVKWIVVDPVTEVLRPGFRQIAIADVLNPPAHTEAEWRELLVASE